MSEVTDLIKDIKKDFDNGLYDKFIHEIHFPKFKNFASKESIKFKFPITTIVGPNGGGKSSVLHAVWGMPLEHSTSRFWFSTPIDSIDNSNGDPNRYWYTHYIMAINQIVECRKVSGKKRHGYWEPSRPALADGMKKMPAIDKNNLSYISKSGDRWHQVSRTPHYINSKAESSAFDRFFYYTNIGSLEEKQDHYFKYSRQLKYVVDRNLQSHLYYGVQKVSENYVIPQQKLDVINKILGKKYKSARYVKHSLFDKNSSPSVIFETAKRNYSESFAGSGELAIVNLVLTLSQVNDYDLVLLDEPETSLHPGAQARIIEYLLRITKEKKLQIIVSTHSPTFVELLPTESLVVLDERNNEIVVRANATKASAFHRLGKIDNDKLILLTEDNLLRAYLERVASKLPSELRKKITFEAANVGVSEMLSNQSKAYMQANSKVIMILDGDQKAVRDIFEQDPDALSSQEKVAIERELQTLHISIVGSKQNLDQWMRWCKKHILLIDYLCAEEILLRTLNSAHTIFNDVSPTNKKFKNAVRKQLHDNEDESDAKAQFDILKFQLGKLNSGDDLEKNMVRFAEELKTRINALIV